MIRRLWEPLWDLWKWWRSVGRRLRELHIEMDDERERR